MSVTRGNGAGVWCSSARIDAQAAAGSRQPAAGQVPGARQQRALLSIAAPQRGDPISNPKNETPASTLRVHYCSPPFPQLRDSHVGQEGLWN
jgi:hypothetical protein